MNRRQVSESSRRVGRSRRRRSESTKPPDRPGSRGLAAVAGACSMPTVNSLIEFRFEVTA